MTFIQPTGETQKHRFPSLERRFGVLSPLDSGMQSRVYATQDGQVVVKVYRNNKGEHELEAQNMRYAGLGDWVIDAVTADGIEALILKRFSGSPIHKEDLPRVLSQIRVALNTLHYKKQGEVDLNKLRERIKRFRSALSAYFSR